MPRIRKAQAGSDSFGNMWPTDGAILDLPTDQASALLAIRDGGFSEVHTPLATAEDDPETQFAEVTPGADVAETPKPRRGRPPKTQAPIEE